MEKPTAQALFLRIQETKKKIKEHKLYMRERYTESPEYNALEEKIKGIREKRKQITLAIDSAHPDTVNKISDLKIDLASDKEMFSDMLLTKFTKGEDIQLVDEYEQQLLPIFSVTLKKA